MLLHHMFELVPLIGRESIHLSIQVLPTATVSTQGQLGRVAGGGGVLDCQLWEKDRNAPRTHHQSYPAQTHTSPVHSHQTGHLLSPVSRTFTKGKLEKPESPEFSPDVSSGSFLKKATLRTQREMFFNKKSEVFLMFCLLC